MQQFSLLLRQRFAPLFAVQFLGAFNDNLLKFAIILFAAFNSGGGLLKDLVVVLTATVLVVPWLLFSSLAGQWADKYEKHRLVRRVKLAEVWIMVFAAVGLLLGRLELMVLALFFSGIQSAIFAPLKYSLLPQYLSADELVGGNGLVQAGTCMAILFGTAVGGQLMAIPQSGAMWTGLSLLLVALIGWWASAGLPPVAVGAPQLRVRFNPVVESMRILRIARDDHPGCIWNMLALAWFWMMGSFFLAILPLYVRDTLHGSAAELAALFVLLSAGTGVGSLLCENLSKKYSGMTLSRVGALGVLLLSVELFLMGWLHEPGPDGLQWAGLLRVGLDATVLGVCAGCYVVPLHARLQGRSSRANCARILAATGIVDASFIIASGLLAALLVWVCSEWQWSLAFVILAFACIHALYMTLLWRVPIKEHAAC